MLDGNRIRGFVERLLLVGAGPDPLDEALRASAARDARLDRIAAQLPERLREGFLVAHYQDMEVQW